MKAKTINKALKRKINSWLAHVNDLDLVRAIEKDVIVTGGCIASMLLGEDVNDFDVYFRTKETAKRVAEYYCKQFNELNKTGARVLDGAERTDAENNSNAVMLRNMDEDRIKIIIQSKGVASEDKAVLDEPFENFSDLVDAADQIPASALEDGTEKAKYRPIFLSTNAITLSDKIQIVIRFHGEPDEIHKNYDFIHCTNYWTPQDGTVLKADALESLLSKELFYSGSKYPLCSIIRTRKFIKRGFHINAGQYLKMCFQLSELDLTDINILEDQLVGVDSAYFMQLIDGLRAKAESDPDFIINNGYLTTIIDRIF